MTARESALTAALRDEVRARQGTAAQAPTREPTVEVEVLLETGTYEGGWQFATSAEIAPESVEDFDAIRRVGQLLWDEAYNRVQGCRRRISFTTYGPNYPEGHTLRSETRP